MTDHKRDSAGQMDALITDALSREAARETDGLLRQISAGQTLPTEDEAKQIYRRAWPDIQRTIYQALPEKRKPFQPLRLLRAAAVILCVISLGLATAYATMPGFRKDVLRLMIRFDEQAVHLSLRPPVLPEGMELPEGWQGDYYPAWLPDGFEAQVRISDAQSRTHVLVFRDASHPQARLDFSELDADNSISLSTQGMLTRFETIAGRETMVLTGQGETHMIWAEGERFFVLRGNLSHRNMQRLAQSIARIQ